MNGPLLRRVVPIAAAAALVAACDYDRASVYEPLGDPSYDFPLSVAGRNVPGGTVVVTTAAKRLVIRLAGLEPLTQGVYQVWLGTVGVDTAANPDTAVAGGFVRATGRLVVVRTDTSFSPEGDPIATPVTVDSIEGASSFAHGGPATQVLLTVDSTLFGANPLVYNVVLISLETDATTPTAPSELRPLWARGTNTAGTKTITFGNFHPDVAKHFVFVATGRGVAGIRGNVLVVDDSALARPPRGYYYAAYLVKRDDTGNPVDTLALGAQTAPFPDREVSLIDADESRVHRVVLDSPMEILAAANRVVVEGTAPFFQFRELWITLENKLGDDNVAAPTVILSGTVPDVVATNPEAAVSQR
jgi:hypothetical protein